MATRKKTTDDYPPMRYLSRFPKAIPSGQVLVHNHVRWPGPGTPLGLNGFRAWLSRPDPVWEPCPCGWAPQLGQHFRVKAIRERHGGTEAS